jgi:hypothetical protein
MTQLLVALSRVEGAIRRRSHDVSRNAVARR